MSIDGLPKKLYKYKGVPFPNEQKNDGSYKDGVLDGLSKGKVWFSHLEKLNDPYENDYDYDDSEFFNDLNKYLSTFPSKGMPQDVKKTIHELKWQKRSDAFIINYLESFCENGGLREEFRRLKMIIKEHKSSKAGILSLCEEFDNLLMWAYYGNDYKGICMEFSTEEMATILNNEKYTFKVVYDNKHYNMLDIFPFYSSEYPNKTQDDIEQGICISKIYAHKSIHWKHEKEWRVVSDISNIKEKPEKGGALCPFPGKLTAVYFGDRASDDVINAVKTAVKIGNYGYEPLYKRAALKKDSYGIELLDV